MSSGTSAPTPGEPVGERQWPELLHVLMQGTDLTTADAEWAMHQMMTDQAGAARTAALLVALRAKGESAAEVTGFVQSMLAHAQRIEVPGPALDIVGTGGDRSHSVNVSTMAALVAAGAGARVVKHGNRAASSSCGSADLLEALGISLELSPKDVARVGTDIGITFCFAPVFHPAMRFVGPVRRELGIPTVFNVLGPLANPAQPAASAVGCGDERLAAVMAQVLADRGATALVFRGDDGLDEVTTTTTTTMWRVHDGTVTPDVIDPSVLGVAPASADQLRGGDPAHNASVARRLLAGEHGPVRDVVVVNAAVGLVTLQMHQGQFGAQWPVLNEVLPAAMTLAAAAIDDGRANAVLDRWVAATQAP